MPTPAVLAHGVVDPVAGSGIPENAADVGQKKSLGRAGRQQLDSGLKLQGIWFPGPQKRDQQGSDRRPAQKIQIGQGKNQNLQAGRQQDQQPRALVHPPHYASITKCSPRRSDHVGSADPGCPAGARLRCSVIALNQKTVELRSTGQPRAAVPTRSSYRLGVFAFSIYAAPAPMG